jgi:hypothetical protein
MVADAGGGGREQVGVTTDLASDTTLVRADCSLCERAS